jgi:hypothetical protein
VVITGLPAGRDGPRAVHDLRGRVARRRWAARRRQSFAIWRADILTQELAARSALEEEAGTRPACAFPASSRQGYGPARKGAREGCVASAYSLVGLGNLRGLDDLLRLPRLGGRNLLHEMAVDKRVK